MNIELLGVLKRKKDTEVKSEKFRKRDFVVVVDFDTQYPQTIALQTSQDKCELLDKIEIGDMVKIKANLNGREWQKDSDSEIIVFNTLDAWKLDRVPKSGEAGTTAAPVQNNTAAPVFNSSISDNDDLPF